MPDGSPLSAHVDSVRRQLGKAFKTDPKLEPLQPELPAAAAHVWIWFRDLRRRIGGGFGPTPISWPVLRAWRLETGLVVRPWEVEAIGVLDDKLMEWNVNPVKQRNPDGPHG